MTLPHVFSLPPRAVFALLAALLAVAPGCSLFGKKTPPTQYAPRASLAADSSWPTVDWQLTLASVQVARPYDTLRIAVRPTPQELQVYKEGTWAQRPAEMLETTLLRVLEDSGRLRGVARAGSGVNGEYRLMLDIRRFEADYAGGAIPQATIEVSAKLLHTRSSEVVASRSFVQVEPAAGIAVPQVVEAFDRALGRVSHDITGWVLTSGASNGRRAR